MSTASQDPADTSSAFHVSPNAVTAVGRVGYANGPSLRTKQEVAGRSPYPPGDPLENRRGYAFDEDTGSQPSYMEPNSSMSGTPEVDHELAGLDALEDGRPGERPAYPFTTLIR